MKTKIIFEDDFLLVCYKPGGLAVQSAEVFQTDMVSELKNYICMQTKEKNPYLGVIHRLDQPVEGLLVFGKTKKMSAELERQMKEGTLKKKYIALLEGIPEKKSGTLIHYLKKNVGASKAEIVPQTDREGKYAELEYHILKEIKNTALAEIQIKTGRFHQIRAQMAYMGYPIAGDKKYGGKIKTGQNLCLCAYYLEFIYSALSENTAKKEIRCFQVLPENKAFEDFLDEKNRKEK